MLRAVIPGGYLLYNVIVWFISVYTLRNSRDLILKKLRTFRSTIIGLVHHNEWSRARVFRDSSPMIRKWDEITRLCVWNKSTLMGIVCNICFQPKNAVRTSHNYIVHTVKALHRNRCIVLRQLVAIMKRLKTLPHRNRIATNNNCASAKRPE